MIKRYIHISLFITLWIALSSCTKNYLEPNDETNYTKLYRAGEDIEAVDFILKPNNSGALILGNSKTINSANQNSNLILFNVDASGYIIDQKEILTNTYDEGQILYRSVSDEIYILGKRSYDNAAASSILVQTNLNGDLVNYNDTSLYENIREIKFNPERPNISYLQCDIKVLGDVVVLAGYIENINNGTTLAIARTYSKTGLFQNFSTEINYNDQIPLQNVIPDNGIYNNSTFIQLGEDSFSNYDLNIYGVKTNINEEIDIINYIVKDVTEFRFQSPSLSLKGNQSLKSIIVSNVDNSTIYIGNNAGSTPADSVFILRGIYNANAAKDSVGFDILSNNQFDTFGNEIIDLAQNSKGQVFVITAREIPANNEIIGKESFVLKFSFNVRNNPIPVANFNIAGNGFHSPKKIKYSEAEDVFYILSSVTFSTEESAIELNKIRF